MAGIYKNGELVNKINNARITDLVRYYTAGIDPKTNKPMRWASEEDLFEGIRKLVRIQDEQDAINTFSWDGLPNGLCGEEIERMLYYKGSLIFFYCEPLDQFMITPYALCAPDDGTGIDMYGRYAYVRPVPMNGGSNEETKNQKVIADYFGKMRLKVLYDIKLDEVTYDDLKNSCVILRDYTNQLPQTNIPRQQLQEAVIAIESKIPCYMNTALKNSTGVLGMRVPDISAAEDALNANNLIDKAALVGDRFVPLIGSIDFQELSGGNVLDVEKYLMSMESVDNLRMGFHGLQNGGMFRKQAQMLQSEQAINAGRSNSTLQDRLYNRQHSCDIINSYTGLGLWCVPKEEAIGGDMNMDGMVVDGGEDTKSYPEPEEDQNETQ